jgi:ribosomal protein S18 acetylase RimI-like enzyme
MTTADIPAGLRLCRAAGWNQLESDWRCFLESSPAGCAVAESHSGVAGTVATLRYEQKFSWISMLLVDPEMRHRGVGSLLLCEALRILEDMETIRLDATPAGKMVYDKFGFVDEYWLTRMKAMNPQPDPLPASSVVRPISRSDFPQILEFDREVFGADRRAILRRLYADAPEYAFVVESPSGLDGFTFGRHGFLAEHLGPVVASEESAARDLVSVCLNAHLGRPFLLDAPQFSQEWSQWLKSIGFREERPFIRMFRGSNSYPGLPRKQFAITGPEFG